MKKVMRSQINLASGAVGFAVRTTFSHLLLAVKSAFVVGIAWVVAFLIPLIVMANLFHTYYGIDLVQNARTYLDFCIPAGNCTWSDFLALIMSVHSKAGIGFSNNLENSLKSWGIFLAILQYVFFIWVEFGIIKICFALYDKEKVSMRLFLTNIGLLMRGCIGGLFGLIVGYIGIFIAFYLVKSLSMIGFLIVFVPMLWILVRYSLFMWFLADRNMSVMHSLRRSFEITRGHGGDVFGQMLVFTVLTCGVRFLTGFSLIISWAASIVIVTPIFNLGMTYLYKKLAKR